jgi:hypothetical protein
MKCPTCNKALVEVVYGFPTMTQIEDAKKDLIALGGNPKANVYRPTHYCYLCQEQFPAVDNNFDIDRYEIFGD